MIGFFAAAALKLSPVGRFLKAIPRPVWIALAALAVLGGAWWCHSAAVSDARAAGYAQGKADEGARIAKEALALKTKVDDLSGKIAAKIKDRNDEENRAIASDADDLRVRGPGKAACPGPARLPGAAGGRIAPSGASDAPSAGLHEPDRIAVPFGWIVNQAERCDLNRGEVLAWRDWHEKISKEWASLKP